MSILRLASLAGVLVGVAICLGGCSTAPTIEAAPTTAAAVVESMLKPPVVYAGTRVPWRNISRQPAEWYASDDALGLAVNVIGYQTASGGWPKNLDMTIPPDKIERGADPGYYLSNIDNDATYTQLVFLARVISARDDAYLHAAFMRGFNYLLAAQYANGGWPQYFPIRPGYYTHITFNDNAIINVMTLLRDASEGKAPYAFVDANSRKRAAAAVQKGIECILRCQIVVDSKPTVWCAQHNEDTFAPAPARSYELASFSGQESVGITRFLMEIQNPPPEIIASVRGAVAWLKANQLTGAEVRAYGGNPRGDQNWARFYDLETGKPFFCGRDGVKKGNMQEIEAERRTGYSWFGTAAAPLLNTEFPAWEQRLAQAKSSGTP